ncbi:hypothetical protein ACSQ67_003221 [Phaseolus vulgaris]
MTKGYTLPSLNLNPTPLNIHFYFTFDSRSYERKQEILSLGDDLKDAEENVACKCYFFEKIEEVNPKHHETGYGSRFNDVLRGQFVKQGVIIIVLLSAVFRCFALQSIPENVACKCDFLDKIEEVNPKHHETGCDSRFGDVLRGQFLKQGEFKQLKALPTNGLNLKGYSESPISPARFFEVVANDLLTLNKNLQLIPINKLQCFGINGAENPVLLSAADQIFSAGGKRMRPTLVFLVARATTEFLDLK